MAETFDVTLARLRTRGADDASVEVKTSAEKLSGSVWESVSAFANTQGGTIVLGLTEATGSLPRSRVSTSKPSGTNSSKASATAGTLRED